MLSYRLGEVFLIMLVLMAWGLVGLAIAVSGRPWVGLAVVVVEGVCIGGGYLYDVNVWMLLPPLALTLVLWAVGREPGSGRMTRGARLTAWLWSLLLVAGVALVFMIPLA